MIFKKRVVFSVFVLLAIFLYRGALLGAVAEPFLEKTLTDLFGMKVVLSRLHLDPITGDVSASRVIFFNQPIFATGPHLDARGLKVKMDFRALFRKQVLIEQVELQAAYYLIDRVMTPNGPTNNVIEWYDHIEALAAGKPGEPDTPSGWRVAIQQIALRETTFVIHDRSRAEGPRKFVFRKINGYLAGFEWPAKDPEALTQQAQLLGLFGETSPAPFWIEGHANFATSQVNFDLRGEVRGGKVIDYRWFWAGSPLDIKEGDYDLTMHVVCHKRNLESLNVLEIKSIKARPGPGATDKIWGLPMMGFIGFIQSQKTMRLNVPVVGYITDANFEFSQAFSEAFRNSLEMHAVNGFKTVTGGTAKVAVQTGEILVETPVKVVAGIGKISTAVKAQVQPLTQTVFKSKNSMKDQKGNS